MAQEITDLDELVGEPKRVKLRGKIYTLPPDLPLELWLRIQQQAKKETAAEDDVALLYEQVLELFRDPTYGDPKLKDLPIGMGQLMAAIPIIYGAADQDAQAGSARPSKGGTRSTTGKRRPPRSRS